MPERRKPRGQVAAKNTHRFTADRRERMLTLMEAGRTVRDACADVGISQTTVAKWAARGRAAAGKPDEVEFARRFDELREGKTAPHLEKEDLIRLLERSAKKGSVQAIKLLLERPWERRRRDGEAAAEDDPFSKLDELAPRREARTPKT